MLRKGSVPGISAKFDKIVHIGHSFGSELSYGLTRDYPSASDGIILTGFSQNATFLPYFELGGNFISATESPLASQYVAGYFPAGDVSGVQTNFFAPGDFDPNVLQIAFQTGQPVAMGELLTTGGEAMGINKFAGPVYIITGERDLPFCGGDCTITGNPALSSIPQSSKQYFPDASAFEVFIVPGSGHGLNLEYSHDITYQNIEMFLAKNGRGTGVR